MVINSVCHVYRLDWDYWPVQGPNALEVTLTERDPEAAHIQVRVRDVELESKYLKGKNWYRGFVDPDLGDYDKGPWVVQE